MAEQLRMTRLVGAAGQHPNRPHGAGALRPPLGSGTALCDLNSVKGISHA